MLTPDERNRRISEGLRLAWERRKAAGTDKRSSKTGNKRLKKIALYLKYLAHLIEEEAHGTLSQPSGRSRSKPVSPRGHGSHRRANP